MNPWVALLLVIIGTGLLGGGTLMLFTGTFPLTRIKASPVVGTLHLLVGMTMVLHFGDPRLLGQIIEEIGKLLK